jgi:twitching motility protein PilT
MEYLSSLLKFSVSMSASDVHIKPNKPALLRIAGDLFPVQVDPPTPEQVNEIVQQILPEHLRIILERSKEADFSYVEPGVGRFRVNVFVERGNKAIVMRHVKTVIPTFDELHLPSSLRDLSLVERGIIFICGATGSGKSTTLAAMVEHVNQTEAVHIVTMEDPVEYLFEDKKATISQREIGLDTVSFRRALTHVLRQDPDVIVIGEMRDAPSFMAALMAAETGHLVVTTLHATTASGAVSRILDFFPHEEREQVRRQLAFTLSSSICQRLIPAIGGGVVPAVEIMINTPTVRKLIEENKIEKLQAAIETGVEDGMQTFNQAIYKLITDGLITEDAGMAKASNPEALKMNLEGIFLDESRRILGG